jgi:hypothetical protein
MPVVSSGYTSAVGIAFLVAARAIQAGDTLAFPTSHHVSRVTVPIVSLLWVVGGGVTVDTTRMDQDRIDLLPGEEPLRDPGINYFFLHQPRLARNNNPKTECKHDY